MILCMIVFYIIFLPILRSFTVKVRKLFFFFLAAEAVWYMGKNIRLGLWSIMPGSESIVLPCYLDLSQKHFSYICKMWTSWLVFFNGSFESRWLRNSFWIFDKLELSDIVKWFIQRYNKYEEKKPYNTYIKWFSLISFSRLLFLVPLKHTGLQDYQ